MMSRWSAAVPFVALSVSVACSTSSPTQGSTTSTTTSSTASVSTSASGSGTTSLTGSTATTSDAAAISHSHTGPLNIMAIGDSITRATCWRSILWQHLNQSFPGQFHFVGTLNSQPSGCAFQGYEGANQGYSSSLITEVVNNMTMNRTCDPNPCPAMSDLTSAFNTVKPDVALIHWGTNDVWNVVSSTQIINAYSTVVDALRAATPNVVIFIAQIIPMNVTASTCAGCMCVTCPTQIQALNTKIATWAPTKSTADSPIVVVDQWTGFDAVADTKDGVHPTDTTGSQLMADKWYAALTPLF